VPFGVKDVIDTAELPTEYGSTIYKGHRPQQDAVCVTRMKAAGAIQLGKTVCTEFATFRPGKTRNPHNPNHTPGGSSSGSAAAVADFMVPLAFGNQTAGSHIRPAAYCGIPAFKPTHGTVDLRGIFELVPAFDTLGYYARSFDDIAAYYSVVRRVPRGKLADGLDRPPRIGIYRGLDQHAEPPALAAVAAAAARLRSLGATVEDMTLPEAFAALPGVHTRILHVVLSQSFAAIYPRHHNALSDILRGMIEDGMNTAPEAYAAAVAQADACKSRINAAIGNYDALLLPSAPGEAPEGLGMTGSPIFQTMWTLLQVPCATVPFGKGPNGLPLGVQLIGKRDDDETLLRLAKWFHTRLG
jgi:Asp-tRNA(Asn)/Glu-tRNA(Gln) amidotransferase A subunit family amidase